MRVPFCLKQPMLARNEADSKALNGAILQRLEEGRQPISLGGQKRFARMLRRAQPSVCRRQAPVSDQTGASMVGRVTKKVVPSPGSLSNQMRPLCSSTSSFVM